MDYVTLQPRSGATSIPSTSKTSQGLDLGDAMDNQNESNYIAGLGCLEKVNFLHIQQQMPLDLKGTLGCGNTYQIKSQSGDRLLYGVEDDSCVCRWLCGPNRQSRITIYNKQDSVVLYLDRHPCRCDCCCLLNCCCCQHQMVVKDATGHIIGTIRERFHVFNLRLELADSQGQTVHTIRGPCCPCRCCNNINFDILDEDGHHEEGYIFKQWGGQKEWVNMDHENFTMQYPQYCSLQKKVILLGAAFLINLMYFEMS